MIPAYIRSPADFARVVTMGVTTESLVLDFKQEINTRNPQKSREQQEFGRDVAQFANTYGGCLLIGIQEELDPVSRLKRAIGIKTVDEPDKLIQWLEQAIGLWLIPSTFSPEIAPVELPDGVVLAVNVFPSQHTLYFWDRQTHVIEVLHRTNHGKSWMNPDELERHIMNGSRAAKIRIDEVVAAVSRNSPLELVGGVFAASTTRNFFAVSPDGPITLGPIGPMAFEIRIPFGPRTPSLQVPYEAVKAAWVAPGGRIMLMLNMRVVWNGEVLTLLPYEA